MKRLGFALLLVLGAFGCRKASDADARQMPRLPPPPNVPLAKTLRIEVEIDGQPAPAIDAARLASLRPDFEDAERRAWRMTTLVGPAAARPGAVVAVTGDRDVTVVLREPRAPGDPQPVLAESRRGGIVAAMVAPDNPFPAYHGQGRRLSRPGDPLPRMAGVTRLRVYVEK
jgi:hypothetical protein